MWPSWQILQRTNRVAYFLWYFGRTFVFRSNTNHSEVSFRFYGGGVLCSKRIFGCLSNIFYNQLSWGPTQYLPNFRGRKVCWLYKARGVIQATNLHTWTDRPWWGYCLIWLLLKWNCRKRSGLYTAAILWFWKLIPLLALGDKTTTEVIAALQYNPFWRYFTVLRRS